MIKRLTAAGLQHSQTGFNITVHHCQVFPITFRYFGKKNSVPALKIPLLFCYRNLLGFGQRWASLHQNVTALLCYKLPLLKNVTFVTSLPLPSQVRYSLFRYPKCNGFIPLFVNPLPNWSVTPYFRHKKMIC